MKRTSSLASVSSFQIDGLMLSGYENILSDEVLEFIVQLHIRFNDRRKELLGLRRLRQQRLDDGILPDFWEGTSYIRDANWTVAAIPADLLDRRVEITGPVERKMIINALNSGASVFMADFEDSNSPTWSNIIEGQINLIDAVNKTISFISPEGKEYKLNNKTAVLMVRPRGWHLEEKHLLMHDEPVSGSLFDFAVYFFHNAKKLIEQGSGPYFYLPKIESYHEARLWNDVFVFAENYIGIDPGKIKATVLIETILAAFEMDEILFELKDHIVGLNCGRWDYIFSFIKKFRKHPEFILPDRSQVTMAVPFLSAYSQLLIKTCHHRKAFAMGGMAAQIPIKNDPAANENALTKVRADKEREAKNGHDGTWVAHPGLVPVAKEIFDQYMPQPNQLDKLREDVNVSAGDLLEIPNGTITPEGLKLNIDVAIQYTEAWLRGSGCVPIYNLMEDAATAEISRAQIWQWIHQSATMEDGSTITKELFLSLIPEILHRIRDLVGEKKFNEGKYLQAADLVKQLALQNQFEEFLTLSAYKLLTA